MIYYDSHQWTTLARFRGSVLPKAMVWALPSALLTLGFKLLELEGYLGFEELGVLKQESVYGGFTYALGFSVVFRTSQSYQRYWTAATSVHEMSSEWGYSCASLMAFCTISRAPPRELMRFRHTVIRLFSLLHAMALEEVASVSGIDLPLLDVDAFNKEDLRVLTSGLAQGRKVQVVLSWIKSHIVQSMNEGILNVPHPILTRVFQELGAGLVNYHKTQNIVIWPFPFPYTQLNLIMLYVYMLLTPLVVSKWEAHISACVCFTFASVTCLMALDFIASELENPFGDDANDLPVLEMQKEMNKVLTMQLNPTTWRAPDLLCTGVKDYGDLLRQTSEMHPASSFGSSVTNSVALKLSKTTTSSSRKIGPQLRWSGQAAVDSEVKRLQSWLKCPHLQHDMHKAIPVQESKALLEVPPEILEGPFPPGLKSDEPPTPPTRRVKSDEPSSPLPRGKARSEEPISPRISPLSARELRTEEPVSPFPERRGGLRGPGPSSAPAASASSSVELAAIDRRCPPIEETPFGEFLEALHNELQEHMEKLLEMQGRELETLERLLASRSLNAFQRDGSRASCFSSELEECVDDEQVENPPLGPMEPHIWRAQRPRLLTSKGV